MVGVLLDNLPQPPAIGVLLAFLVEVKQHSRARGGALCRLNVKPGLAVADPAPGLVFAGLARDHLDAVGNHEGAIEPHAKLTDEVRIFLGIAGELGEEVFRARAGDGAQV